MPGQGSKDGDQQMCLVGQRGADVTNSLEHVSFGNDLLKITTSRKKKVFVLMF